MTSTGTSTRRVISRTAVKVSRSAEAAGEGGLRRLLDDGAVHDRIGVGRAELEDVGAVLGEGDGRIDARLQVGEAERQVADEHAAPVGVGGVDRRGDARSQLRPSPWPRRPARLHDGSAPSSYRSK